MAATGDRRPLRIGISGSYGGFNLGDEAILGGVLAQVRASVPAHVTVFSRDANDTQRRDRRPARRVSATAPRPETSSRRCADRMRARRLVCRGCS